MAEKNCRADESLAIHQGLSFSSQPWNHRGEGEFSNILTKAEYFAIIKPLQTFYNNNNNYCSHQSFSIDKFNINTPTKIF